MSEEEARVVILKKVGWILELFGVPVGYLREVCGANGSNGVSCCIGGGRGVMRRV